MEYSKGVYKRSELFESKRQGPRNHMQETDEQNFRYL